MLTESTANHIEHVRLAADRPVIICDVDEVVVHFIRGLEAYLERNGLWLHAQSFALNGNIKSKSDDNPISTAELKEHLSIFFDEEVHRLAEIDGAATALNAIADHADVVMLTNIPAKYRLQRIENLAAHGLDFPVITNEGPKGPAVKQLLIDHSAPAVFIDDIPTYLQSVADHCPHVHLVHFMQDSRFAKHAEHVEGASLRTNEWQHAHQHILALLDA